MTTEVVRADPVDRCRSCAAPVMMLRHQVTGTVAPIELEPVAGGNILVDLTDGTYAVVGPKHLQPGEVLHRSHFATCPKAGSWRRR